MFVDGNELTFFFPLSHAFNKDSKRDFEDKVNLKLNKRGIWESWLSIFTNFNDSRGDEKRILGRFNQIKLNLCPI